jgi:hypothetical protein
MARRCPRHTGWGHWSQPVADGIRPGDTVHATGNGPAGWPAHVIRPEATLVLSADPLGPADDIRSTVQRRGIGSASAFCAVHFAGGPRLTVRIGRERAPRVTDVPIVAQLNYAS